MPTDELFDFKPHLPSSDKTYLIAGFLSLHKDYRLRKLNIANSIVQMIIYYAYMNGYDYGFAAVSPIAMGILKKAGFFQVEDPFVHEETQLHVIPMKLNLHELPSSTTVFMEKSRIKGFMENFHHMFCAKNTPIIKQGDQGDCAYLIVDGEATAQLNIDNKRKIELTTLSTGDVFGELGLLFNTQRKASVIAKTDMNLMVLDHDTFIHQVVESRQNTLKLIGEQGKLIQSLISMLSSRIE